TAVIAYRVSRALPGAESRQGFALVLGFGLLAFELGNLWLVYRIAGRLGSARQALRIAWAYTLLGIPLYYAVAALDAEVVFFLLLGLEALLARRYVLAGVATGLGGLAKLIPLILVPVGVRMILGEGVGTQRDSGDGGRTETGKWFPFAVLSR